MTDRPRIALTGAGWITPAVMKTLRRLRATARTASVAGAAPISADTRGA